MNKQSLIPLLLIAATVVTLAVSTANPHDEISNSMSMTAEEAREAREVAKRFTKELQETKDLTPIVDKLFVSDFLDRYLQDPQNYPLTTLEKSVAQKISREELRRYYIASGTLEHLSSVYFASKFSLGPGGGKKEPTLEEMYPPGVADLFKKSKLAEESDAEPTIISVEQLHNVLSFQEQAVAMMRSYLIKHPVEQSQQYKNNISYLESRGDLMKPEATVCKDSCFGFPAGVRLIVINVPFHQLLLVEVSGQLKILSVVPHPS